MDLVTKIRNGTRSDSDDLCKSCASCTIRKGARDSDEVRYCDEFETHLTRRVSECTGYYNKNLVNVRNLQETAWILTTSPGRQVGFVPYNKFKEKNPNDDFGW